MSIETVWHSLLEKLEKLRHKADPELHKDIDAVGLEAAKLKAHAEAATTGIIKAEVPVAEKAAEAVVESELKQV